MGYTKIDNGILEKVCRLDLPSSCFRLLMAVLRYTVGFHRERTVFGRGVLEDMTGMSRERVRTGLGKLCEKGIITVCRSRPSGPITVALREEFFAPFKICLEDGDKRRMGVCKNVLLSDLQYSTLTSVLGEGTDEAINDFSLRMKRGKYYHGDHFDALMCRYGGKNKKPSQGGEKKGFDENEFFAIALEKSYGKKDPFEKSEKINVKNEKIIEKPIDKGEEL